MTTQVKGRYLLFCGEVCYPNGGMRDYAGSFATLELAVSAGDKHMAETLYFNGSPKGWYHVFDSATGAIVAHTEEYLDDDEVQIVNWQDTTIDHRD